MSEPAQPPVPPDPDQIVVALGHLYLLTKKLRDLEIEHAVAERSEDLGLALVTIPNVASAAAEALAEVERIRTDSGDWVTGWLERVTRAAQALSEVVNGDDESPDQDDLYWPLPPRSGDLTKLLWALRRLFKHEFSGWSPTMGRNRDIDHVHGVWAIIHSEEDPKAAAAPRLDPRLEEPGVGVRVGVLDTKLYPHEWLDGGYISRAGKDLLDPVQVPTMAQGHATFVTGLVLDQAPGAVVVVRAVLDEHGRAKAWKAAEEIVRLGRSGVNIINLSFACYTEDDEPPLVLATAIDRLDPDIVVVAAAGNSEKRDDHGNVVQKANRPAWPAALDDVVAVGAATRDGQPARFSPSAPWVDALARGTDLISTYPKRVTDLEGDEHYFDGGWATWEGTSFASALIAGAIAAGTVPGQNPPAAAARALIPSLAPDPGGKSVEPAGPTFVDLQTRSDVG